MLGLTHGAQVSVLGAHGLPGRGDLASPALRGEILRAIGEAKNLHGVDQKVRDTWDGHWLENHEEKI